VIDDMSANAKTYEEKDLIEKEYDKQDQKLEDYITLMLNPGSVN
jgi:hypothetical protein